MPDKFAFINEKILSSGEILRALFQNISIGIALTDLEGNILITNTVLENLLTRTSEELQSCHLKDVTHPDDYEKDLTEFQNLLSGKQDFYSIKKRYITKDKKTVWGRLTVSPLKVDDNPKYAIALVEDLSERVSVEKRLAQEEKLLNILLENTPDSIYFKDEKCRFIKVNKATCRKFGLEEEEILGKTDFDIFSSEHAKKAYEDEKRILSEGKPIYDLIEKETWPDGSETWAATSKLPMRDNSGKIIGTFGISRDVTAQKEVELKLKESEERYRTLSQVTFEGILIHDKGIVIDINNAALKMTGYNFEEVLGKNIITLVVRPDYHKKVIASIKENSNKPYEIIVVRKDGSEFVAEIEGRAIQIKGQELRAVAVRDVTERKRGENIQDALYKISQAVNTIEDINDLYERIHEIIKTLMPADNFYIALHDKGADEISFPYFVDEYDPPPERTKFGRGLTEYLLRTGENQLINAERDLQLREEGETDLIGEPCKIWLGIILKIKDEVIGALVLQDYKKEDTYGETEKEILTFVSEQIALAIDKKKNEEQLKRFSSELQELVASKDKFFSIVAHDLKSPFTALLGYSEMIANEYMDMSKDELREFAINMNDVSKKTFTLLENLLDWSRIQTGRMKFHPENIGLFQVVQQVMDLFIDNAKKKGVTLKNKVNPLHEIFADSNMIFTVLRNLTSNAIKFTQQDDEIVISSERVKGMIQVSVKDTGKGMKEEDIGKLFRIDIHHTEIGTEQEKGTGLGLILCKELVEKNSGRIWVESKLSEGSTFFFTIPTAK